MILSAFMFSALRLKFFYNVFLQCFEMRFLYMKMWVVGLSPCMCICHNTMDAFKCRCNSTSHQYKVNLDQRPFWLFGANLLATRNGAILVIVNHVVTKMFFDHGRILINKLLTIEIFWLPFKWQPKPIFGHHK
jgi:hypothetical protein